MKHRHGKTNSSVQFKSKAVHDCACTRCGKPYPNVPRFLLKNKAGGVRCDDCGGNVVDKRFAEGV